MILEVEAKAEALLDATGAGHVGVLRRTHNWDSEIVCVILTSEGGRRTARQDDRNEQGR